MTIKFLEFIRKIFYIRRNWHCYSSSNSITMSYVFVWKNVFEIKAEMPHRKHKRTQYRQCIKDKYL